VNLEWINLAMEIGLPLLLLALGFVTGRVIERRHLAALSAREAAAGPLLTNLERLPGEAAGCTFCMGSVVVAADYFKLVGAGLKTLVGGRLRTLETIVDRGRREALLRMREQAARHGADFVMNVRIETAIVRRGMTEVIAYGTAVRLKRDE
jgi:uncharacterized protein YbjQ (UPF0145 family)